jgi:hypothetical protein
VVPEAALLGRPVVALVTREGDETVLRHLVHLQAVGLSRLATVMGMLRSKCTQNSGKNYFLPDTGQRPLLSTSPAGQAQVFSRNVEDCTVSQVYLHRMYSVLVILLRLNCTRV